jgi:hypothetical protein
LFFAAHRIAGACLAAALGLGLCTSGVRASPWPQQEGHGFVIGSLSYLQAHNSLANANPAFGDGTFSRAGVGLYGEYGLTPDVTVGGSTMVEQVRLRGSIVPGQTAGIADVELFARPVLWRGEDAIIAAQGTAAIPTGYALNRNPALGDGAVGLEPSLLFGEGFALGAWPSFFDIQAGYRFRLGVPADQIRIDATLGTHPAEGWMLLLQSHNNISARNQGGGLVGLGYAGGYGTNFDLYSISFSAVRDIEPEVSLELGMTSELAGRNYNTGNGVFFSLWRKF